MDNARALLVFCAVWSMAIGAPIAVLDMSHVLDENSTLFRPDVVDRPRLKDTAQALGINNSWVLNNFEVGEHVGTHMDAPTHFKVEGATFDISQIPLEKLFGPAVKIDVRLKLAEHGNAYALCKQDVLDFEEEYGRIPDGAIVAMCSGWSDKAGSLQEYWGNEGGDVFSASPVFPGFGTDAADWLAENRNIRGLATDSGSCDVSTTTNFSTHAAILGRNLWCIEGLANSCDLPATGATMYAFPSKIAGGSGIPLRVVGMWGGGTSAASYVACHGSLKLAALMTLLLFSL